MSLPTKTLAMDRAAHRGLRHVVSEAKPATTINKILVITSLKFLQRRASDNSPLHEISTKVVEQMLAQYDQIIVFSLNEKESFSSIPSVPNLMVCIIDRDTVFESMRRVVLLLKQQFQVDVKMPKDPRRLSWLNIGEYISDERVRVVGADDYQKACIEPDKDLSFNDLTKIRAKKSWI